MSIKKFQVNGIILIDCWGGEWIEQQPVFDLFNKQVETFIRERIEYEYIVSSSFNFADNLRTLPGTHITCRNWKDLEDYFNSEGIAGHWLIGGQSWNICFHNSMIGPKQFLTRNYINCLMFSHPKLVFSEHPYIPISDSTFKNDTEVRWTKDWAPLGTDFWLLQK